MLVEQIERRTLHLLACDDGRIMKMKTAAATEEFHLVDVDVDPQGRRVLTFERLKESQRKRRIPLGWSR